MANRLVIYKDMTVGAKMPYRIADVFPTLDGFRTRLSTICFSTLDEANAYAMQMEGKNADGN